MDVIYRDFHRNDEKNLSEILIRAWRFDKGVSDRSKIDHIGCLYLYYCLRHAWYVRIADMNGEPVGLIIGTLKRKKLHPVFSLRALYHYLAVLTDKETRNSVKNWSGYFDCNKRLDDASGVSEGRFDAEVTLFAVGEEARGKGIGRRLFQDLVDAFRKEGVERYYLHTDTECSYGFYDKWGMERLAEDTIPSYRPGEEDIRMFVYGSCEEEGHER